MQKLHTYREGHEKAGQFIDEFSIEFWYVDLKKKKRKEEEHSLTSTSMLTNTKMRIEVEMGMKKRYVYGFGAVESVRMRIEA